MIRKQFIRFVNGLLKPLGARLVKQGGASSLQPVHDPSSSYMKDAGLRALLNDELSQIAQAHFSERLGNLSAGKVDYSSEVDQFMAIYTNRPLKDNTGGSGFHNAFWLFLTARTLNPTLIVESGVWRGHTSWLLEQACPKAEIIGFDINLSRLEYVNGKAQFHEHDWSEYQFENVDPERSLIYFDCHVNNAKRIVESASRGFRHLIFDDNPPAHKLYAYGLPGFPTANMVDAELKDSQASEISWSWQGKDISYRIDREEMDHAKKLLEAHEEFPDVGGPTRHGGFSFLAYVKLCDSPQFSG